MLEEACPYYLSIGMTYEQYWYASPYLVETYRKADEYKQDRMSQEAWLQGLYIYGAFGAIMQNAFGKKGAQKADYFKEPFRLREKTAAEKQAEIEKARDEVTKALNAMANAQKRKRIGENGSNDSRT